MELHSRYVFLDTCIFQQKNFQFLSYELKALKSLVDAGQAKLLITDVTVSEVRSHIAVKSREAAAAIKKLKKDAMILRNFPSLPSYGVFKDVNVELMELELFNSFDKFLESDNVNILSVNSVRAMDVFELYFSVSAPFAVGEKSKEFSDAFVLETLKHWALSNNKIVHVISTDGDMLRYCSNTSNLLCSSKVDEFIEAVNRSYAAKPSEFADKVLKHLYLDLCSRVKVIASSMDTLVADFFEFPIAESIDVQGISIVDADLMSIDDQRAEYSIEFSLEVVSDMVYESLDFERDDYIFDQKFSRTARYTVPVHAFLALDIEERILEKSKIINIEEYSGILILENARDLKISVIDDSNA